MDHYWPYVLQLFGVSLCAIALSCSHYLLATLQLSMKVSLQHAVTILKGRSLKNGNLMRGIQVLTTLLLQSLNFVTSIAVILALLLIMISLVRFLAK